MSDVGLRACSSAARGLWVDLKCFMHQGSPYGYLCIEGADGKYFVPDEQTLARMTGNKVVEIRRWVAELEAKGVAKRDENGTIFSPRMVRDEAERERWRRRQERARNRRNSIINKEDDPDVTRDNPRDITRDVTPQVTQDVTPVSPRSPPPSPRTTSTSTATAEEGVEFSTFPQADAVPPAEAVWWNDERAELDCEPSFAEQLYETYPDASKTWLRERWTYHGRWLSEHPERLRQLREKKGLTEWIRNRIREDYARDASKPRTADEILAAETRRRLRRDRIR